MPTPSSGSKQLTYSLLINGAFAKKHRAGFAYDINGANSAYSFQNSIRNIIKTRNRLQNAFIECKDVIELIKTWDRPYTCFYCDPPYPGTYQEHYSGYTIEDWKLLCDTLDNCKGSYVLSNYAQEIEPKSYDEKIEIKATMSASRDKSADRSRTEILWIKDRSMNTVEKDIKKNLWCPNLNYFQGKQLSLF